MSFPSDTIAALATPTGTSSIAVVRASGPLTATLAEGIFGGARPARVAHHADYRDRQGTLVDDVLFTRFAAPNSFSGEDTLEISCHGNPYIAQRILEDLYARGCRPAEAGEFSKRAFLNGRLDLTQAEAIMDLIHARSERALAAANQQLRGSLGRHLAGLVARLVKLLAQVEAYIDFPDEDLPPEDRQALQEGLAGLRADTGRLLATNHYGALLRDGFKTVILGETNAGKSSLLNRLVGHDRALVSPDPGTTRDYIEERIVIGGHLLRLIDTAGLNSTPTSLERQGIGKTMEQAADADLYLWVVDSTKDLPSVPGDSGVSMTHTNTILVRNKIDLPVAVTAATPWPFPSVDVSALSGAGLDSLRAAISAMADTFRTELGDEVIAINARHALALEQAGQSLARAQEKSVNGTQYELLASDLRDALAAFCDISGKIDNERILDVLFANFCIGK